MEVYQAVVAAVCPVEAKDHQDAFEVQVRAELGILGLGEY